VFAVGDFNSAPSRDESYSILLNSTTGIQFDDAKTICSTNPIGPNFTGSGYVANSRTSGHEVDHVYVYNVKGCTRYQVIDDYEGENYPSDHFPVIAVIEFNE
ncbi:MAG: endonuclease/exonuclease/phosphatase family protein, partial [Bacteroidales bacterium]